MPESERVRRGKTPNAPAGSRVFQKQENLFKAVFEVLDAVAEDVRGGLLETVGVNSRLMTDDGKCSMVLDLPENADAAQIALAIDLENVESWLDAERRVRVGISPWLSTKDVDQTVLCAIKVIHVLLGVHATDDAQPKTLSQKIKAAIKDVLIAQKEAKKDG